MNNLEEELKNLKKNNVVHFQGSFNLDDKISRYSLNVKSISKIYESRPVVKNVSLELKRGEAVGLLGPNGAGKTTCFYMIAGLIECDSGDIFLDKHRIN
ncbi:MAG: ATP-binding cassette domain-containing protein, partial [Alphaproteobacteria bacterium]|nr:ATP-binding cassette domain-containing protein [Alphaproteobacteria bacterium]